MLAIVARWESKDNGQIFRDSRVYFLAYTSQHKFTQKESKNIDPWIYYIILIAIMFSLIVTHIKTFDTRNKSPTNKNQ